MVGVARTQMSNEQFRDEVKPEDKRALHRADARRRGRALSERDLLLRCAMRRSPSPSAAWPSFLKKTDSQAGTPGNYLFYLSVAPEVLRPIVQNLGKSGLAKEENGRWRRVIIEKPFGHDLPSAGELNRTIKAVLGEKQIYRIDHYLGKETVQNLMVFRFGNGMFEPIWNRNYIDHVQITVAEELGVESRGGYYDTAGALRDMVPNHIAPAGEPGGDGAANLVQRGRRPGREGEAARLHRPAHAGGRAAPGGARPVRPGRGRRSEGPGYRQEPNVAPDSNTETFVALRLMVDNWRWAGVPFYAADRKASPEARHARSSSSSSRRRRCSSSTRRWTV